MTDPILRAMIPGQVINDTVVTGLHVRCLPSGKKSFMLYYRTKTGAQRRPKLGDFPSISVPQARKAARMLLSQVAAGLDPKDHWDEVRAELSINDIFEKAWAEHWDCERFKLSRWAREVKYNYANHIRGTFGHLKLSEIDAPMIREWHRSFQESKPYAGNRSLEVLSRLFTFAEEKGLHPMNQNPCTLVAAFREKQRERAASEDEVKRIGVALFAKKEEYPVQVAFIFTLIFSGARPRAIERALKNELSRIEYEGKTYGLLTLKGKTTEETGISEKILIPDHIMALIDELPPHENEKLFGIRMPTAFWNRIKRECGITDLWIRDWRRTFASVGLAEGVTANILGETLNHRDYQTTKIYARLSHEARISAVSTIADRYKKMLGHK